MNVYLGLFFTAFSMLALEVSFVRLLSVTTWYHLSFFAISTAMLGMTAGAIHVYLRPDAFSRDRIEKSISANAILLVFSIPLTLTLLCLVPLSLYKSVLSVLALFITTAACALPYYFAGTIISAVLTKYDRPMGRLYASDLLGASLGCLFVLAGLEIIDTPSLILLCSATSAFGGICFSWNKSLIRYRRICISLMVIFAAAGISNSLSTAGIRPLIVKGWRFELAMNYLMDRWNSFSRVAVYHMKYEAPQYWGPSPLAPDNPVSQYGMNIDGAAGTFMNKFESKADIEHLRYDITNIGYHLDRKGSACIIGVGGGRDIQSALLFGHQHVTGVEINPIFIDLLQDEFKDFAGIAGRPDVTLVKAEARSYLTRTERQYNVIQMSLIDTWAATGAGAFSLTENSLYTVEAWEIFLSKLKDDGIFTVSRWYSKEHFGETGRVISLAMGTLLRLGEKNPSQHIALITINNISTLLICRRPFTKQDVERLSEICEQYKFQAVVLPGCAPEEPFLQDILSASNYTQLLTVASRAVLNYTPPTDESPYFFNMLRLRNISSAFGLGEGVIHGNLVATLTLGGLLFSLILLTGVTIIVPLTLKSHHESDVKTSLTHLWSGAVYFSLIGAAFMLTEIALIQRLTILLSHPIYALGILLFTIIASAGMGSLLSDRLPFHRRPWIYIHPVVTVVVILGVRFFLSVILKQMVNQVLLLKIITAVGIIFPLGFLMGMFFPIGMRLVKSARSPDTPWYWALNGIFGVLCSAVAVIISVYMAISINFYIASVCYGLVLIPLEWIRRQAK